MDYYQLKDDPNYNCQFIVTERGVGKTTSALQMVLRNCEFGEAIWVRRSQVELDNFYGNIKYHWITKGMRLLFEKNQMVHVATKQRLCTFIALSTCSNWSSSNFDNVNLIIFDEYISETGGYLKNEMFKMLNFFQTIERNREGIKHYYLSNAYSKNNPFFNYFEINKKHIAEGEFVDNEIKVKFEFIRNWKNLDNLANNFSNLASRRNKELFDFMHRGAFTLDEIMDACIMTEIKKMKLEHLVYNIIVEDYYCGIYEDDENNWYMKRILPTADACRTTTMSGLFHNHSGYFPERLYELMYMKLANKECFISDYELRDAVFRLLNSRLGSRYDK